MYSPHNSQDRKILRVAQPKKESPPNRKGSSEKVQNQEPNPILPHEKMGVKIVNDIPNSKDNKNSVMNKLKRDHSPGSPEESTVAKRTCLVHQEKEVDIDVPKPICYDNLKELLVHSDNKSRTFVTTDIHKNKMRCINIMTLWKNLIRKHTMQYPYYQAVMLRCSFINFFGRMVLYIFNALNSVNTAPTTAVLDKIKDKVDCIRNAFKDELLSHVVTALFNCLHKSLKKKVSLDISVNSSKEEVVECFVGSLVYYYKECKKKSICCCMPIEVFSFESDDDFKSIDLAG